MTDNEIIKALEWWLKVANFTDSVTLDREQMSTLYNFVNRLQEQNAARCGVMARYIDAERVLEHINDDIEICRQQEAIIPTAYANRLGLQMAKSHISVATTADVVEVVRCKDCKHRRKTAFRSYCLPAFGLKQITDLNGFCSYGERRDT